MFVVVVEYGPRRRPRAFGPFFEHSEAQAWLNSWALPEMAKSKGFFVPHNQPHEFKSATIQEVRSHLSKPKYPFLEKMFNQNTSQERIEFRLRENSPPFLTIWKQRSGMFRAKDWKTELDLEQWRGYALLIMNDTHRG